MDTAERRWAIRASKILTAWALAVASTGCAAYGRIEPRVPISADVRSVHIALDSHRDGICPRETVRVKVVDGEGVELPEAYLALRSDEGTFDRFGNFTPDPDIEKTAFRPFVIDATVLAKPTELHTTAAFRPDYTCVDYAGASGLPGAMGDDGHHGNVGTKGVDYADSDPPPRAHSGGRGEPGGPGEAGGHGIPGPHLIAYVTWVTTPFHERLVAVRTTGDVDDLELFPAKAKAVVRARGGDGGPGGHGGHGGWGGFGGAPRRNRGKPGANGVGGAGGEGGDGGDGGDGGTVTVILDERYPDLADHVVVDVHGGAAGDRGGGAIAGRSPIRSRWVYGGGTRRANEPVAEWPGTAAHGIDGQDGRPGADGTTTFVHGDVRGAFGSLEPAFAKR